MPSGLGGRLRRILIGCALALLVPAAAQAATPGALSRYDGAGDHWVTTGPVPAGYALESTLGFLSPVPAPGTAPLYGCLSGGDHFLSLSPSCGGQTVLSTEGWIYTSPPSNAASSPVYLCLVASTTAEDHFASVLPNCEGQITVGLLGYALNSAALNRYNGGKHWVTTGSVPGGYGLEGTLGYLVTGGAGTSPLYGCADGSNQFLSLDRSCEGQTLLGLEGWIYGGAPASVASDALYRCRTASDHFAALDPGCEGQVTEGRLGYTLQGQIPVPPPAPAATPPVALSIPEPLGAGRRHLHLLHVRITFTWTWGHASTHLRRVQIGRLPRRATVRVSCKGASRGCHRSTVTVPAKNLRHLVRSLTGRVYRSGDRLFVTVTARGYQSERAEIRIRHDKLPAVGVL
jgi:hypothetical protein